MTPELWASVNVVARRALLLERSATSLGLQRAAMRRDGVPAPALDGLATARRIVRLDADRAKREVRRLCKGEPLAAYARRTHGLGDAVLLFAGCAPPLSLFPTPARLWKYCGLAPGQVRKRGERAGFSPRLKAIAIKRLAEPCMKHRASLYRGLYDARRARTVLTHPEWTDGHAHNDALRIVAKAILLDLWLVENGKAPVVGAMPLLEPRDPLPEATTGAEEKGGRGATVPLEPKGHLRRSARRSSNADMALSA